MDSATLLYYLLNKGYELEAICFDYGQKHSEEIKCAEKICKINNIKYTLIDINFIGKLLDSSLTQENQEIPEKDYSKKSMKSIKR